MLILLMDIHVTEMVNDKYAIIRKRRRRIKRLQLRMRELKLMYYAPKLKRIERAIKRNNEFQDPESDMSKQYQSRRPLSVHIGSSQGIEMDSLDFRTVITRTVNERYSLRLKKRLQFEERKYANQRRLLSDSESVRWLNHAVAKIWPICMEQVASQQFLLPIIPWFLDKFKPWTARKAVVQSLYLGRSPPMFTDIRVLTESADDDHLVLELGMSFLSANDMSAVLEVQLRKRFGLGIRANLHVTGMHVEGKVLVGVKFLRDWPFIGRVRVCFVEPPYFQMTVKPIINHGVDVTELPGIAGWMDNLLSAAFGQTLVEPNMLVVDVEKFVSAPKENWFTIDEKRPIAFVKLEIVEAAEMKPSDTNGLADPYIKGHLGPYRFQTKIQKKTLSPKWHEEFKIPISSWEAPNLLVLQVRDKDHIFDDMLGDCSINISDLRGGQRHDKWLSLQNIKMGRVHVAITVLENEQETVKEHLTDDEEQSEVKETVKPVPDSKIQTSNADSPGQIIGDEFEPIKVDGQQKTGVWVHHPGSEVSQTCEPRKGSLSHPKIQLQKEDMSNTDSPRSVSSESYLNHANRNEENVNENKNHRPSAVRKGLQKLSSVFHKLSKNDSPRYEREQAIHTPRPNLRAVGEKGISVNFLVDDNCANNTHVSKVESESCNMDKDKEEILGKVDTVGSPNDGGNDRDRSFKTVTSGKNLEKSNIEQESDTVANQSSEILDSSRKASCTQITEEDNLKLEQASDTSLQHSSEMKDSSSETSCRQVVGEDKLKLEQTSDKQSPQTDFK